MKILAILFVLGTVVSAIEQEKFPVPKDRLAKIRKISEACAQEFNVDSGYLKKIADGTLPNDESATKYLYCTTVKTGLVKEDGHMIVDKVADLLGDHPLKGAYIEAVNKCNEVTKEDNLATVKEMNRCFVSTIPIRFVV